MLLPLHTNRKHDSVVGGYSRDQHTAEAVQVSALPERVCSSDWRCNTGGHNCASKAPINWSFEEADPLEH